MNADSLAAALQAALLDRLARQLAAIEAAIVPVDEQVEAERVEAARVGAERIETEQVRRSSAALEPSRPRALDEGPAIAQATTSDAWTTVFEARDLDAGETKQPGEAKASGESREPGETIGRSEARRDTSADEGPGHATIGDRWAAPLRLAGATRPDPAPRSRIATGEAGRHDLAEPLRGHPPSGPELPGVTGPSGVAGSIESFAGSSGVAGSSSTGGVASSSDVAISSIPARADLRAPSHTHAGGLGDDRWARALQPGAALLGAGRRSSWPNEHAHEREREHAPHEHAHEHPPEPERADEPPRASARVPASASERRAARGWTSEQVPLVAPSSLLPGIGPTPSPAELGLEDEFDRLARLEEQLADVLERVLLEMGVVP